MKRDDLALALGQLILCQMDHIHKANMINNDILRDHYEKYAEQVSSNLVSDPWRYVCNIQNELTEEMKVNTEKAFFDNAALDEKIEQLKDAYDEHLLTGDDLLMLVIKYKSPSLDDEADE